LKISMDNKSDKPVDNRLKLVDSVRRPVVFSAVQPTGSLTLGNYLGAVQNWVRLQHQYTCYYAVADLHSLTLCQDGAFLRARVYELYAMLLACGIDPDVSVLFCQSSVAEHAQLAWVLNCYCQYGQARRMTQFKDKSYKSSDNVNVGLFAYPILQAADILLYNASFVPIGADQKQHLELTRDIAMRFNTRFSPTFAVPEVLMPTVSAKLCALQDPTVKMSKSDDNVNNTIYLSDTDDAIVRKVSRAVTDSGQEVKANIDKPGILNLLNIYSACADVSLQAAEQRFVGVTYAQFKASVADAVVACVSPIREQFTRLIADKAYCQQRMQAGAAAAKVAASKMLSKVYKKVGLG
jgi:tryptophanyl-tRNA synthetase